MRREENPDNDVGAIELVDGKPKVEWEPKVNRWTGRSGAANMAALHTAATSAAATAGRQ